MGGGHTSMSESSVIPPVRSTFPIRDFCCSPVIRIASSPIIPGRVVNGAVPGRLPFPHTSKSVSSGIVAVTRCWYCREAGERMRPFASGYVDWERDEPRDLFGELLFLWCIIDEAPTDRVIDGVDIGLTRRLLESTWSLDIFCSC